MKPRGLLFIPSLHQDIFSQFLQNWLEEILHFSGAASLGAVQAEHKPFSEVPAPFSWSLFYVWTLPMDERTREGYWENKIKV